jgi:hypothetical protein
MESLTSFSALAYEWGVQEDFSHIEILKLQGWHLYSLRQICRRTYVYVHIYIVIILLRSSSFIKLLLIYILTKVPNAKKHFFIVKN